VVAEARSGYDSHSAYPGGYPNRHPSGYQAAYPSRYASESGHHDGESSMSYYGDNGGCRGYGCNKYEARPASYGPYHSYAVRPALYGGHGMYTYRGYARHPPAPKSHYRRARSYPKPIAHYGMRPVKALALAPAYGSHNSGYGYGSGHRAIGYTYPSAHKPRYSDYPSHGYGPSNKHKSYGAYRGHVYPAGY